MTATNTTPAAAQRTEIVFIESNIADYQTLLNGITPGAKVHILDAASDGLVQMAGILAGRSGIDAIHILSHGAEGSVQLGSLNLRMQNLQAYATELQTIGSALTQNADILLYGCDVAKGSDGAALIAALVQATLADVAASDDLTGSDALGGDWVLESAANVETAFLTSHYARLLPTPSTSTTFDAYSGYVEFATSSPTTSGFTASNVLGWDITTKTTNNGDTETWLNAAESQYGYSALDSGDADPNSITGVIFKSNDTSLTLFDLQSLQVHYDRLTLAI